MFKDFWNFLKSLEKWERYDSSSFWACCIGLYFSVSVVFGGLFPESTSQSQIVIEKNTASVLATNRGGGKSQQPDRFVPPVRPDNPANPESGSGSQDFSPKPKYPWGIDPSYNPNGGGGGALSANQIPDSNDWISDPYDWDKSQNEEEEEKNKLGVAVDFQHEYDSNGNPTLLVPNPSKDRTKREYNRVEFEQTASHIHHAPDLGIQLPGDFDMSHYKSLNRADRIEYAKQKLPRESIINYQNEIGKSMSSSFGSKKTFSVPGFAGKFKVNTELTLQQTNTPDKTILSIIREDGLHISSFPLDDEALLQLTKDNFWVLKDRTL
jgi:hypothetical protein